MDLLTGAPPLYVRWRCVRCGYDRGVAKTTMPLDVQAWSSPLVRHLFDELRLKLVRVHLRDQGCCACVEDFRFADFTPQGATVVGKI